jgi:hypothetical protein
MKQIVNFEDEQLIQNDPANELVPMETNMPPFLEEPEQSVDQLEQQLQAEQQVPVMSDLQQRLARYQDLKNKMNQDGFDQRNKDQGLALLLKASQQIGQGMANRYAPQYKADTSVADTLYKQAEQNVTDIADRQKLNATQFELDNGAELNEVDSSVTNLLKERFLARFPNTNPENLKTVNGAQLIKLLPELRQQALIDLRQRRLGQIKTTNIEGPDGKVYKATVNPDTGEITPTTQLAGFAPSVIKDSYTGENKMVSKGTKAQTKLDSNTPQVDTKGQEIEQSPYEKLEPKYRNDFTKNHASEYEKETKETQQKLSTLNSLNELATTVRNSTPENKRSNLNAFATAVASFYQKGVLSDKDVERYIKTPDVRSRFLNAVSSASTGTLDDTTVDQIMNGVNIIAKEQSGFINRQAEEKSKQFYNKHEALMKQKGIGPTDLAKMLNPEYEQTQSSSKADPKIEDYAKSHNLSYEKAMSILKARGYNGK